MTEKKFRTRARAILKYFGGIGWFLVGLADIVRQQTWGLYPAQGLEATITGIFLMLLGVVFILSAIKDKSYEDITIPEFLLFTSAGFLAEIVAHFVFRIIDRLL